MVAVAVENKADISFLLEVQSGGMRIAINRTIRDELGPDENGICAKYLYPLAEFLVDELQRRLGSREIEIKVREDAREGIQV